MFSLADLLWHDRALDERSHRPDELRPVTVLFADVVGSTSLGERLAPDEVKALIGECVSRMSRAVEEFGGSIQAYQGDGICAYFGVPAAHEDDPERAARAALRILDVVGEYGRDVEAAWGVADFGVRVGVNSGQTAVGLVGAHEPQEVALGDTTNVAARLQSAAEAGTVAVGEATARRLAPRFRLEPLGNLTLKGRGAPVPAWRLIGAEAAEPSPLETPLVGRDDEVARLRSVVDELRAGRGQILLVTGPPGIGKTRLLAELRRIAGDQVRWLEGHCVSYGGELTAAPFVEIVRSWLGVAESEPEIAVRTRLRARLAGQPDALPGLARLLAVRLDGETGEPDTHAAYAAWVESVARRGPLVVAVEDLHWADPATRELAEELARATDRAPLLLVATFAPDPEAESRRFRLRMLDEFAHRTVELPLGPLSPEAASELLAVLAPGALDDSTRAELAARAEGSPLYLAEFLRSLIEGDAFVRRRTWTLTVGSAELLPPALENLLVARIDRLPEGARRLVQLAAVIGRTFPVRVVERLAEGDLQADLAALMRAEVVRELRRYPELECTFTHGLLQEAALSTLTRARREELFGRVAAAYEELYAGALDEHLELLAHYYARSLDLPKALDYLERAGERASGLGASGQAAELWRRAGKVARRLGDEAAERRVEARLAALEL